MERLSFREYRYGRKPAQAEKPLGKRGGSSGRDGMDKRHPTLFLTILLTLLASPVDAQVIRGHVVDAETQVPVGGVGGKLPISGAEVELVSKMGVEGMSAVTDELGYFFLAAPAPGAFRIRVSHPAYLPYEGESVDVGLEETVNLEIRMGRKVIPLEPIVVTARTNTTMAGFHERRTGSAFATFLTREEIQARGAGRTTDLLRGVPGVRINFERWGVGPAIEMRNGFGDVRAHHLRGRRQGASVHGEQPGRFSHARADRGGGNLQFPLDYPRPVSVPATAECILFWTRRGGREGGEPWSWKRVLLGLRGCGWTRRSGFADRTGHTSNSGMETRKGGRKDVEKTACLLRSGGRCSWRSAGARILPAPNS